MVGDLLAWLWGQNMGYLSRLEALLSQDKSFQQIDEICKQLEATQVRMPLPLDSRMTFGTSYEPDTRGRWTRSWSQARRAIPCTTSWMTRPSPASSWRHR